MLCIPAQLILVASVVQSSPSHIEFMNPNAPKMFAKTIGRDIIPVHFKNHPPFSVSSFFGIDGNSGIGRGAGGAAPGTTSTIES